MVVCGALIIAGIGFVGSYAAVRELAEKKGFGAFSLVFPVGVDAGICVLLALDLLLTWIRIPFPLLRQTAWLLTTATIAFNGAAAWPDALGVGMHAVMPILFIIAVEAARHAIGRIADITADKHMEGVRLTRWLLSPLPTFLLWRRMKLWEIRNYEEAIRLEQHRLVYESQLRAEYGRAWRRKAPIEAVLPLRLARYGIPLAETAAHVLEDAGLDISVGATRIDESAVETPQSGDHQGVPDTTEDTAAPLGHNQDAVHQLEPAVKQTAVQVSEEQCVQAIHVYGVQYGVLPNARQLGLFLLDAYGVADPLTGGPVVEEQLRPILQQFRQLYARGTDAQATAETTRADMAGAVFMEGAETQTTELSNAQPIAQDHAARQPMDQGGMEEASAVDAMQAGSAAEPSRAPDLPAVENAWPTGDPTPQKQFSAELVPSGTVMTEDEVADQQVMPQQQAQEPSSDPIHQQIVSIVSWLDEAEEAGEKLSGAEVARRLGVSPRTGQRRLDKALEYRSEQQRFHGRAHLRSVSG
ncbi:DUF2637 domain-containing protein [Streptomyces sp. NPDC058625]|uniref:DUF2637 domain-containing protein n=1 Tax=Streptomyces sp. NPDC058625 TaxID=3346564 RepID=UPI00366821C9